MSNNSPSSADLRNPDYVPPMQARLALGLQHVLAMFVSNFTPAIIIGGAACHLDCSVWWFVRAWRARVRGL